MNSQRNSKYFAALDKEHAERYTEKIKVIGFDPYMLNLNECSQRPESYPKILYPDIVNYLVYGTSTYTNEMLKAYEGLEAYKQAACGWVQNIWTKDINNKIVVIGKVMHSQRINERLTNTWLISEMNGTILSAHCDCVASLGETCTHVCALLFTIDDKVRKLDDTSVTDVKAYWVTPATIKPIC